ncbi:MAG: hypothetical protein KDA25_08665, partial [Phycisphaerales bacterium]|nr:hypothetical protein [Phycisphaerales bacterium]
NNESRSDFITLTVTEREIGVVGPDADFNNDGVVDAADLAILLAGWGDGAIGDLNGDGTIDPTDLAILLSLWGPVGG